ncbi:MAG: phosphoribosylglycinamide formyltransferase [Angelakisella sp.]
MVKIAVLVSGGGTNLQAILDAQQRGELAHGRVTLVVSSRPGVYALERANAAKIDSLVVARKNYATSAEFDAAMVRTLREHDIAMVVLAGFLTILGAEFIAAYRDRILNIHPSLIPSFCGQGYYGLRVHQAALQAGVKVTGATAHLVNEVCDGGRILLQKAVEVLPGDTPESLQLRVMQQAEWELLPKATELLAQEIATAKTNL